MRRTATGQFTKQEVITRVTAAGLKTRRGLVLSPQSFGQVMRNLVYIGRVESPDYGVSTRGDFDPLVDAATFYRAQAVLDGRVLVAGPRPRNHPGFRPEDSYAVHVKWWAQLVGAPQVHRINIKLTTLT